MMNYLKSNIEELVVKASGKREKKTNFRSYKSLNG